MKETLDILEAAKLLFKKASSGIQLTQDEQRRLKEYEKIRKEILKITKNEVDIFETGEKKGLLLIANMYPKHPSGYSKNKVTADGKPVITERKELCMDIGMNSKTSELPIVKRNADGTYEVSSVNYLNELRNNLTTQWKYYQIKDIKTGETISVAHYQPNISFELVNKEVSEKTKKSEGTKKTTHETQGIDDVLTNEEDAKKDKTKTIQSINTGQRQRVVNYLFAKVLKGLGNKDITYGDVIEQLVISYKGMLDMLSKDPARKAEFEYLSREDVKNEIVGLGKFSETHNTLKEKLELYIDKSIDESDIDNYEEAFDEENIDGDSTAIKLHDTSGFEFNVKSGLSSRLKRMFAAIPKVKGKSTLDEFAGLEDYYEIDEVFDVVQEVLSDIPNTIEDFTKALDKKLERNPKNFEFLSEVKERFKNADKQLQFEVLYRLNQTRNKMFLIMYENEDKDVLFTVYNANSKDPVDSIKRGFYESFKSSAVVKRVEEGYILNMKEAKLVIETFRRWEKYHRDTNYVNIDVREIIDWLSKFGINVTEKTIEDLKNKEINGGDNYETFFNVQLFRKLYDNILSEYNAQEKCIKDKKTIPVRKFNSDDTVKKDTGGYLLNLAAIEAENIVKTEVVMRIAGKNVMPYSQPNATSEQVRKLVNPDGIMLNNLKKSAFSKNSALLKVIEASPKFRSRFGIGYIGLQALKNRGSEKNSDRAGITELPESDFDTVLLGFNNGKTNPIKDSSKQEIKDNGIGLVEAKLAFPPLSDSAQLFVLNTIKYDIRDNDVFDIEGNLKLSDRLLQILYEQLVLPDLVRIIEHIQAKNLGLLEDDVDFQNLGSELFTLIHSLNTLKVGETELLTLVRNGANNNMTLENIMSEDVINTIKESLESMVLNNVNSKFNVDSNGKVGGSFVREGIVTSNDKGDIKASRIDKKYLNSRSEKGNITRKIRTATVDFVINHLINQAQIQMVFTGDMSNYTEKPSKLFKKEWASAKEALVKKKLEDDTITNKKVDDAEVFFYIMSTKTAEERKSLYNDYFKLTGTNLYKRLKEHLSPGNRLAESKGKKYAQIVVNDKETASENLKSIIKLWYPDNYKDKEDLIEEFQKLSTEIENAVIDKSVSKESLKEKKARFEELKGIIEKAYPNIKDYMNITSTDGQEFTTWKEHLDILYYQGRLSEKDFDAITKKLESQSKDGVNESNRLSHSEKKAIFQPIKPLHSGLYFEDKGSYKRQRYVYVKTSSFPLLPEMTLGFKIDNIRKNIEKFEKDKTVNVRVTYKSGIKVGGVKNPIDIEEFYDEYDNIKDKLESSTLILDRENFSIQQDKPYKLDKNIEQGKEDENNRGTQIDKILFGNGINKVKRNVFPNMFDKELLEAVGIDSGKELLSGEELYKLYNHIAISEQQSFRRAIFEELGINSNNTEWYNSYETLNKIQDLLNERMSNYQDREIIKLKIKTLEKDGKVRFVSRETMIKENLIPVGAEFEIPLWISPNSQKFESVMNSIINNRFIKLKISGSSSPVGSEEGFRLKELKDLTDKERDGIIFTDSFDGTLRATHYEDGKLKTAQVLLPSKFRRKVKYQDEKGKTLYRDELIDLREYTKVVDGRTILDNDKVDKEILEFFSFRIPTSSHQSGAIIEVVGFLPHASADLMIVPKDHVTQIGEDFDIDVRYYYKQHILEVEENGVKKLRRLKDSDIPKSSVDSLDELYNNYNIEKQRLKEEMSQYITDLWRGNKEILYTLLFAQLELEALQSNRVSKTDKGFVFDESVIEKENELQKEIEFLESSLLSSELIAERQADLKKELKNQLNTLRSNLQREKLEIISNFVTERTINNVRQKVMENNMIALYKSIYSTTDETTQRKINATLTTDFANKTANLIDEKSSKLESERDFSILDDIYQKKALRLGASGKLGIGVHSKWVVFNSLLQQQEKPIRIISHIIKDDEGNDVPVYMNMVIGNLVSEGYLGKPNEEGEFMTLDGDRSIATVNMENQNCSTDNQKLQIMGRRNENKYTINVFALMCNLGFDKASLQDGTKVHIPSLFISQPIIRRYVELMEQKDSMFTEYDDKAQEKITEILKEEFGKDVEFIKDSSSMVNYAEASAQLTGQVLLNNLEKPNNEQQWAVYQKFIELNSSVQELNRTMNLLNIEKDGLGISFFNTISKKDALISFLSGEEALKFENITELFGQLETVQSPVNSSSERIEEHDKKIRELIKQGYVFLAEDELTGIQYYAKPTTSQNAKLINSISVGYNLWKDIFPFEEPTVKNIIKDIIETSGVDEDSVKGLKLKYLILENMKDFLYSDDSNKLLFSRSIEEERISLTIDNETTGNESLAHYLHRLKSAPEDSYERNLMNETFFKNLELILFNDGKTPSYIKYSTSSKGNINKNDAYIILENMLDSNQKLPAYNGNEDYTVHDLLKDLVKYSLIANQERGAIGFRNYIPVSALRRFGVLDNLKRIATAKNNHYQMIFNGYFRAISGLLKSSYDNYNNFIPNRKGSFTEEELMLLNYYIKKFNESMGAEVIVKESTGIRVKTNMDAENMSIFVEQFYQHNPDKAKKIPIRLKDSIIENANSKNPKDIVKFAVKDDKYDKPYLSIKNRDGSYNLYKNIGNMNFVRIPLLGSFGMNEYQTLKRVTKSAYGKNNFKSVESSKPLSQPESLKTTSEIINHLLSTTKDSKLKVLLQELKGYDRNLKVIPVKGLVAHEGLEGKFIPTQDVIEIDANVFSNMESEAFKNTFLEEYIHSITSNILGEWVESSGISFKNGEADIEIVFKEDKKGLPRPYYIDKLIGLYKEGIKAFFDSATDKEAAMTKFKTLDKYFKDILAGRKPNAISATSEDVEMAYRIFSIDEFIAGIFVSPEFRKIMDNTPYRGTGKSILKQFKDVVKRIINALTKNTVENSITEHVIDTMFAMMNKKDIAKEETVPVNEILENETVKQAKDMLKDEIIAANGKMTFSYGNNKRKDVTSTTTFEAIKKGERTATTRYESDGHLGYWSKLKIGDRVEFESATGEKVIVIVTKPLHKLKGSGKTAEQWSKLEGWSVEYFNSKVRPKLDEAWQFEYKLESNQEERGVVISEDGRYTTIYKKNIEYFDGEKYHTISSKKLLDFINKSKSDKTIIANSNDVESVAEVADKYGKAVEYLLSLFDEYDITATEAEFIRDNPDIVYAFDNTSADDLLSYAEELLAKNITRIDDKNQLNLDFENDTQNIGNVLRPSFETLFSQGIIETQGFQLTLSEFNSMTKEEQDNFKKCL